ncbi:MAG TPA: MFS transporter [Pseudonocardia sp.]|jgi:DHA2 family multidrug resistance protein-like MFS transporter|nr:MFS transporter [Pseudonocardia sp.]
MTALTGAGDSGGTRTATGREWFGVGVLALACLVYSMDQTALHLAIPAITEALHPSSAQLLWIIDGYGFLVAGWLVTMGTLGDRIGRRRLLLVGAAAFALVSVLTAVSTSPEMLIISRGLLGLAGATIAPSTLSLIFHMITDARQRTVAIGVWIGAYSAGAGVGPVVGGLLLEWFWWGSVFLIGVPVMVLLVVVGPAVLPEYRNPDAGRLDLTSVTLSVVAVLAVVYGVKQIAQDGVRPASVIAVVVGAVVGAIWVRRQRSSPEPMVDLGLFRIRSLRSALVVTFMSIFVMIGYFLFVDQYLQLVLGQSPLIAGLWSLPSAAGFVTSSQLGPRLVRLVRPAVLVTSGLAVTMVGLLMLSQVSSHDGLILLVTASVLVSLGMGPVFGLTTEMVVGAAPREKAGAASGISETAAELGGALGIAVLGSIATVIYRNGLRAAMPSDVAPPVASSALDTLGGAVDAAATMPGDSGAELRAAAQQAFVSGMSVSSVIAAVIAAVLAVTVMRSFRERVAPSNTALAPCESRCAGE